MQQQISVVTLGIADLARSRRFYVEGFGWKPVFENRDIVFYQMNGLMLGTWLAAALQADQQRELASGAGRFSLAHNVSARDDVQSLLDRLGATRERRERAQELMRYPLHPRLARILIAALERGLGEDGCRVAALLGSGARFEKNDLLTAIDAEPVGIGSIHEYISAIGRPVPLTMSSK